MTANDYLGTLEDYSFQFSRPPPREVKTKKYVQITSKDYILNLSKVFTPGLNTGNKWEYSGTRSVYLSLRPRKGLGPQLNYTELVPDYSHLLPVFKRVCE